jgi:hypothetical protein
MRGRPRTRESFLGKFPEAAKSVTDLAREFHGADVKLSVGPSVGELVVWRDD